MKKWLLYSLPVILIILINHEIRAQKVTLLKETHLLTYPSASGIAYYNHRLYLAGDDAKHIIILDTAHQPLDSILIFPSNDYRLDWKIKPDIESLSQFRYRNRDYLMALSSFSASHRNKAVLLRLDKNHRYKIKSVNGLDNKLRQSKILQPNIEGTTIVKKSLVASNRANLSQNINHLIIAPAKKRLIQKNDRWQLIEISIPQQKTIMGISGLEYYSQKDLLFFTASTEATSSANADGEIGDSYLGYFNNFSNNMDSKKIQPSNLINLSKELKIGNQKIEGICVERADENHLLLHLVADNDNGQSIIYKVLLSF